MELTDAGLLAAAKELGSIIRWGLLFGACIIGALCK